MNIRFYITLFVCLSVFFSESYVFADQFPVILEAKVKAVISAEREGVLNRLDVDAGDRVKKGGVMGVVFHKDLILRKQLSQATRKYLTFQVDNLEKLNAKGIATDEEVIRARMDLAVNGKEIEMIKDNIYRSRIRAPFSGIIVSRLIQPHEWVRPGQPIVEMYDPRQLRIVADIPFDMAVKLKSGQTHQFFFRDIEQEISGKLSVFSPQVDVRSNTVKIYWTVNIPKKERVEVMPGMKGVLRLGSE